MASTTLRAKYPAQLAIMLDQDTYDRIGELAAATGVSKAEVTRDLIGAGLEVAFSDVEPGA